MSRTMRHRLLGVAALVLTPLPALAQTQTYRVFVALVAAGGTSTGGGYEVSGTIEASAGGPLTGGTFSVSGGFQSMVDPHTQIAFADDPLVAGVNQIRIVHVAELRARIDAVRAVVGLAAYAYADPTLTAGATSVRAQHFLDLRTALTAAYVAAGRAAPTFAASVTPGVAITAAAIAELRAAVIAIE